MCLSRLGNDGRSEVAPASLDYLVGGWPFRMSDAIVDPPLTQYPKNTGAFGRLIETASQAQTTLASMKPYADDLKLVTDEELVILSQVRGFAKLMIVQEAIAAEVARRNIAASIRVEQAIDRNLTALSEVKTSLDNVRTATEASSAATVTALGQVHASLDSLRIATDSWSRWLTRLTIAVMVFTAALLVVAILQVTR